MSFISGDETAIYILRLDLSSGRYLVAVSHTVVIIYKKPCNVWVLLVRPTFKTCAIITECIT